MNHSIEHNELHEVIFKYFGPTLAINNYKSPDQQDHELTDAILAAGYRKQSESDIRTAWNEGWVAGRERRATLNPHLTGEAD